MYLREPEKKSRKAACILVSDVQGAAPTTKGMIRVREVDRNGLLAALYTSYHCFGLTGMVIVHVCMYSPGRELGRARNSKLDRHGPFLAEAGPVPSPLRPRPTTRLMLFIDIQ